MEAQIRSKIKTVSPESMCRLCLTECIDGDSINIFDADEQSLTVRIMACAGLEVTIQDTLPKKMCLDCRLDLEKSFLFRSKCKNSDLKLRRHFRLINAGKESHVFDDSEDEGEDEYVESFKVIYELEEKIEQKQNNDNNRQIKNVADKQTRRNYTKTKAALDDHLQQNSEENQNENAAEKPTTSTKMLTRASNRQNKDVEPKHILNENFENNETIEILVEDDDDEHEIEYIITESVELDEQYGNVESNDEAQSIDVSGDAFELQSVIKENDGSDDDSGDGDDKILDTDDPEYLDDGDQYAFDYDDILLENILPLVKKSVAERTGRLLDDKTQYKIIRNKTGDEIQVQCIPSDGKHVFVEMIDDSASSINTKYERDEHGDFKIFKCSKCPKTFSRRGKMLNHERDHTAKPSGQECPYCQKWFPSNSTLTRHIRVHTGEKPFECDICGRSFIQKEILKRHTMTHSGERPFKCEHCSKTFILKDALRQHINRNHTENPTPEMHQCPFCSKNFCHSSGLSRHLLIHAGRTFDCEYCRKKFNDKSALKRHTTTIHNVVPKKAKQKAAKSKKEKK